LTIAIDGASLRPAQVAAVAVDRERVKLHEEAERRLQASRRTVDRIVREGTVVYGISTGVGALQSTRIPASDIRQLQLNLLMSHAVGVGEALPEDVVRAAILVRVNQFCQGSSGVRPEVAHALIGLLNSDICPWVPCQGSLGASGDLAQSAHVGLVLIGEGRVRRDGRPLPAREALSAANLKPISLEAKDGLSILNGTHFMSGAAALVFDRAEQLLLTADVVASMSLEALRGTRTAFDSRIHQSRPHPGQLACAQRMAALTQGSQIIESHRDCDKVQDPYSLRCIPQVHGAVADAIAYLGRVLATELNAATDNPLVFPEGEAVLSGGNFHGEPLALALDFAAIALSGLGGISERRLFRLLTAHLSDLPPFLTRQSGVDNGYMLIQYTAAALAADNQMLSVPASVHSLPTSADQEDHNSMGWHSALKALRVVSNLEAILGLEALAAAQGIDLLAPLQPAPATAAAHRSVRERIPPLDHDRNFEPELEAAIELVRSGKLAEPALQLTVQPA
jgi:histidine ammonia-lyase